MAHGLSEASFSRPLVDQLGRRLLDLRMSVTDRCNFRCRYCMPREKVRAGSFLPRSELLTFEELETLAASFVDLGVEKIRLTGGEPLLRQQIHILVEALSRLPAEVALTTNGTKLASYVNDLKSAGLDRITVSLDALDERIFQQLADAPGSSVKDVLRGIDAAEDAGFTKMRINCVVRRGVNESEILPLARWFGHRGHVVRFIEFMDVGTRNAWRHQEVVSQGEICEMFRREGNLRPLERPTPGHVARRYAWQPAGQGEEIELGVIASVTEPFCGDCCRARVSSNGKLYHCLFAEHGTDVREPLRRGVRGEALSRFLAERWASRRDRYSEERLTNQRSDLPKRQLPLVRAEMSYLGG